MFWLLSLLLPGSRRRGEHQGFDNFSHLIKSPQSRGLLFQVLAIIAAAALLWFTLATILSFLQPQLILGLIVAMAVAVFARQRQTRLREHRIQQGCCAQCGYDLRATPDICPECGRNARLDEPTWRRVRRELEAKLLADAAKAAEATRTSVGEPEPPSPPQLPADPMVRVVTRRPELDDTPIPLEGD